MSETANASQNDHINYPRNGILGPLLDAARDELGARSTSVSTWPRREFVVRILRANPVGLDFRLRGRSQAMSRQHREKHKAITPAVAAGLKEPGTFQIHCLLIATIGTSVLANEQRALSLPQRLRTSTRVVSGGLKRPSTWLGL